MILCLLTAWHFLHFHPFSPLPSFLWPFPQVSYLLCNLSFMNTFLLYVNMRWFCFCFSFEAYSCWQMQNRYEWKWIHLSQKYIYFWWRYVLIRIFSSVYLLLPPLIYHSYSPPQLTSSSSFLLPSNGESYSPFNIVSFPSSSLPPGTSFYSHPPLPFSSSSAVRWKVRHSLPSSPGILRQDPVLAPEQRSWPNAP